MQTAFETFSDIFAYRDNVLTRLDPRLKVVATLLVILAVILSTRMTLPLTVFGISVIGARVIRVPVRLVLARLAPPLAMVSVLIVLQSVLIGSTSIFSFSVVKWKVDIFQEGAQRGLLMGCRVLGAAGLLLLMSFTTKAHQVFLTLRWLGVPKGWVEVAMLMYRYTFSLLDQTADILSAQRLRLGYSSIKRSLSSIGVLAGSVIVLSMDQAVRTYDSMVLRGYRGSMPFGPLAPLSNRERWGLVFMPCVVLSAYLLCEWGPL